MDTRQLAAFCAVVERKSFSQAAARLGSVDILVNNAALSVPYPEEATAGLAAGEPVAEEDDAREDHGWTYTVDEVPREELAEVLLVNAAAPFLLVGRLRAAMARSPFADRFVVNVWGVGYRLLE